MALASTSPEIDSSQMRAVTHDLGRRFNFLDGGEIDFRTFFQGPRNRGHGEPEMGGQRAEGHPSARISRMDGKEAPAKSCSLFAALSARDDSSGAGSHT